MNRIPIALFRNREQAQPIQQRLLKAGVVTEIHEEQALQRLWFVSRRAAGVTLEVAASQFETAQKLLGNWDTTEGVLAQTIRCPECKSLNVDYPQFARNSVITNMAVGLAAGLGFVEKDYYCESCHYTWPKQTFRAPRKRPHMAPYYFIEGIGPGVSSKREQQPTAD
jgi:hypothetical protein